MIHVITTNEIDINSIHDYVDNFVIVHLQAQDIYAGVKPITKYIFDVYHKDGMKFDDDEYESSSTFVYNFHPMQGIVPTLNAISSTVESAPENDYDDTHVALATTHVLSPKFRKYLDEKFTEDEVDVKVLDLLQYMHMPRLEYLTRSVKSILNSEFVYQDDPIAYSYAVYMAIIGGISL